ncbi:MAG: GTP 3',8-cyclase MoaA, partial [Lysobacteraceae bacterium]
MSALPQALNRSPTMPQDRLGRPLRDLRLSVIEACNFRCGYCMPADRVADDHGLDSAARMSFDEIE